MPTLHNAKSVRVRDQKEPDLQHMILQYFTTYCCNTMISEVHEYGSHK